MPWLFPRVCSDAERCLDTYSSDEVVGYYCGYQELQKPEQTLLQLLLPRLSGMRMLEIGVGGGRLTAYFAPGAASYHGIDLCPRMVDSCRRRFSATLAPDCFAVGDMRRLAHYPTGAFDLVLIGYNTIDHLDHAERELLIDEVRRVIAPGGFFCFSTHNIASLAAWLRLRTWLNQASWRNPPAVARELLRGARLVCVNRRELARHAVSDHVIVNNGTHGDFGFQVYYVRPSAQVEALRQAGFGATRLFSLNTGAELAEAHPGISDRWLYYLCA